jgi:hypothetical protein
MTEIDIMKLIHFSIITFRSSKQNRKLKERRFFYRKFLHSDLLCFSLSLLLSTSIDKSKDNNGA